MIVQKYGGTSLARSEQIKNIAQNISQLHKQGNKILVVVSAVGNSTNELVDLAYNISERPNRRELDMLLTTGERVSMALMSMALSDLKCPAISFTGSQAGVLTDASHSHARILDIKPMRLETALDSNQVVVLAGFQGVDPHSKEITTLGRGGSDTTAVAMAMHFRANICQILKDVEGVYSGDPRLIQDAKPLKELSYDSLAEMCFWGAKVLHFRSVVLARRLKIPLFVGLATDPSKGTKIHNEVNMYEQECVLSVNTHEEVHHIKMNCMDMEEGMRRLENLLQNLHLPWPQVLASAFENKELRLMITGPIENLKSLLSGIHSNNDIHSMDKVLSSVTATCHGSANSSLPGRILKTLKEVNVSAEKLIASPLSITVFVDPSQRERASKALHDLVTKV